MTKRDVIPPARDGETLSDERRIDELLREFQMACEDAAEFNADSIRASAKHRAILRNELRSELLAVAALRAELADARADTERLDWLQAVMMPAERYCEVFFAGMRRGNRDAEAYQIESNPQQWPTLDRPTVRQAIDAARSAFGEDRHG